MSVEDTASRISVIFGIQHDCRNPISGVHVSLGSVETLVRREFVLTLSLKIPPNF